MRIVIVGGGIAGLGVAYHLARAGAGAIRLLEQEPSIATHSSGRNAAIYAPLDDHREMTDLAARTGAHLDDLFATGGAGWLRRTGFTYVSSDAAPVEALAGRARARGVAHELLAGADLTERLPVLGGGRARCGLLLPDAGVLDIHAVASRLAAHARAAGVQIALEARVTRVSVAEGRASGVDLATGEHVPADAVVIAGGAWAASLGASCGAPLPFVPLRRHLVHLDPPEPLPADSPVVWALEDEVYFRPETGGVLASPCDEVPWPPSLPPPDAAALDILAEKLSRIAPRLGPAGVRRAWACLRTFAPDRMPVAGADARVEGLFWLAGLGGSGMTVGLGAAEVVAACVRGDTHPLAAAVAPSRAFEPAARR
jgi:glycine/D-amino acid oxidase-like deaminating enzyme